MCIPRRLGPAGRQASAFSPLDPAAECSILGPTYAEAAHLSDRWREHSRPPRLRASEFLPASAKDHLRICRNEDLRTTEALFSCRQNLKFPARTLARSRRKPAA